MSKQKKYYFHSYGFAAEHSVEKAVRKAQVELERNSDVLSLFYDSNDSTTTSSSQELRLVHFSTNEGFSQFEEMTKKSPEAIKLITHTPRLMIDLNIPGPWSKYTCVWRCLYEPAYPLEIQKHEFFF